MEEWLKIYLNIGEEDYKFMLESNPFLSETAISDAEELISFLKRVGCDKTIIRDTIMSNALVLSRSLSDLEELVTKLQQIGLTDVSDLIDANPYILNLDAFEIDDYIAKEEKSGRSFDEIVDALESEPALFLEI